MKRLLTILVIVLLFGCSKSNDSTGPTGSSGISGLWDSNFDEISFLSLTQNGENVSGNICERQDFDCMSIIGGSVQNDIFSFYYSFDNGAENVDGVFQISLGGTKLTGTLTLRSTEESVDIIFYKR